MIHRLDEHTANSARYAYLKMGRIGSKDLASSVKSLANKGELMLASGSASVVSPGIKMA